MRTLRLRTEALPELAPDALAAVAAAAGPPTESLLCAYTDGYECQSLFYECYSRGCTRQEA